VHEHIAQLEIEQKSQRTGKNTKPQPAYALALQEGLLRVARHDLFAFL
jgi:hypothetical protein